MHSRSFPASVKPRHKPGDSDRRGRARTVASSSQPARPSSHSHTGRPGPGACDCERRSPFSTTGVTTHPPTHLATTHRGTEGRPPGTQSEPPAASGGAPRGGQREAGGAFLVAFLSFRPRGPTTPWAYQESLPSPTRGGEDSVALTDTRGGIPSLSVGARGGLAPSVRWSPVFFFFTPNTGKERIGSSRASAA